MRAEAVAFLAEHGFIGAARQPLPADASFRRYTRLVGGPRPALLMEAPPPQEDLGPYLHIAAHLAAAGLSAPVVLAADARQGFALVEDFGAHTMAQRLDAGAAAAPLYLAATAALARLHAVPPPPGLPAWGVARMAETAAATFLEWWWPESFGEAPSEAVAVAFGTALHAMLAPFAAAGFVHRDFFPANLMPLPGRTPPADVGLLDFQDAALGHPAYDLVSLVEDARRDVDPALREACIEHYLALRPELDADAFRAAMAAQAAQRHLRVACLWVRLARRDGKPHYLRHGPRCWALLGAALAHPATAPLRDFLDRHVPPERRRNPDGLPDGLPHGLKDSAA
ncbi:aminoglycoside phosphotransferase family protein [Falsiroseomonas selenitidurans]|uniref:Phosphotransferase n=1 Tax=Falsiroseomonas selenitidurans TaxID=2716335 RepID=A0ABX1E6D8_9PROT|nr:phosphotransferase [Falsiroseomonas selenitidurans]NKC32310.1 phosphotransferase [Falsiroseomonas selenitidurans]